MSSYGIGQGIKLIGKDGNEILTLEEVQFQKWELNTTTGKLMMSDPRPPKPFSMNEYIKGIEGVSEWIASLSLPDENYALDVEMCSSARSMPTFSNPYALQCSMTPECKVTIKRYAGGLEEIYTSTFINGQQCATMYTATLVGKSYGPVIGGDGPELVTLPKESSVYPAEQLKELGIQPAKNELEKFHDDLLDAMQPKEEIVTQDEDDEDYYDSVWR